MRHRLVRVLGARLGFDSKIVSVPRLLANWSMATASFFPPPAAGHVHATRARRTGSRGFQVQQDFVASANSNVILRLITYNYKTQQCGLALLTSTIRYENDTNHGFVHSCPIGEKPRAATVALKIMIHPSSRFYQSKHWSA